MAYTLNQPVDADDLSISSPVLRANTNQADQSFGTEHYPFSDLTPNNGLHKKITTVTQGSIPVTGLNPVLAGFSPYSSVGAIQYSCGPQGVVPTPVTSLQSVASPLTIGPASSIVVMGFAGINYFIGFLYVVARTSLFGVDKDVHCYAIVARCNGIFSIQSISNSFNPVTITTSGQNLIINNSSGNTITNLIWTMDFKRIQ